MSATRQGTEMDWLESSQACLSGGHVTWRPPSFAFGQFQPQPRM